MAALKRLATPEGGERPDAAFAERVARAIAEHVDAVHGGIGGAPKFPQAPVLELIWRTGLLTGDRTLRQRTLHTLARISQGGIYDHLGGGFARYSVDAFWLVPHFEKMLYDNAQLLAPAGERLGGHGRAAVPRARGRDGGVARARDAGGRRLRRLARRRQRGRGGQVLRLDGRRDRRAAGDRTLRPSGSPTASRPTATGKARRSSTASTSRACPGRPRPTRCAAAGKPCSRRASAASARAATTRCWPTGTA